MDGGVLYAKVSVKLLVVDGVHVLDELQNLVGVAHLVGL